MSFSENVFNKDLHDLTIGDLDNYFSYPQEESITLEFKSFPGEGGYIEKERAVIKSVCAMLNSEGGIVIWGAPTESIQNNGKKLAQGEMTAFKSTLDRDSLINKLSSSITPMPVGIRVQVIKNSDDKSVFVIEVQKSPTKPHQFRDKYFIRLDGQTRVAPHYLIEALMKGVEYPILRGHLRLKSINNLGGLLQLNFNVLLYNCSKFINDLNVQYRIGSAPGRILINGENHGSTHMGSIPILSNGTPRLFQIGVQIPAGQINNEIRIVIQVGGEKAPSKVSSYKYRLPTGGVPIGMVADESVYLVEKEENQLPSDVTDNDIETNINVLLDGNP